MTQKEKAKAYDKVREKIALRFGSNVAEEIFSEYEESEDERIRKALINGFNKLDKSAVWYNGITNGQILAWLEAQGEQKPAWSEEDKVMLDKVIERLHKHSAGDKEYLDIYYWLIALKDRVQPQPKQEWKPSDEQIIELRRVISGCSYDIEPLAEMEEQLKKLRGE